jgi:alpha-tubulin suppressor-like RCC1 family protein
LPDGEADAAAVPCSATPRVAIEGATWIAAGGNSSCAVAGGKVMCWGSDDTAIRGQGSNTPTTPFPQPVAVQRDNGVPLEGIAEVSIGTTHACALGTDGKIWCWGFEPGGALGTDADRSFLARPLPF